MNLTELQIEIKEVEKHLSSIRSEIEKLKPKNVEDEFSFDDITKLAEKFPIYYLPISKAPDIQKRDFIKGLSYLLLNGERDIYEGLLYISRLSIGIGLETSAQDIYISGLSFEKKDLNNLCENIKDYSYSFVVEAFIIANLCENNSSKIELVAEFAEVLGFNKEDMCVVSHVAKSKLTGKLTDLNDIPLPSENKYGKKFDGYISDKWIEYKRKEISKILVEKKSSVDHVASASTATIGLGMFKALSSISGDAYSSSKTSTKCTVVERESAGKIVRKGDSVLTYKESNGNTKKVKAEFDGILYFIKDTESNGSTYLYTYIVSYFDDYDCFCKWFKENR